ncbi:MAG: helicase C-terminal domain-containing protein [Anaerolineae bacterium]
MSRSYVALDIETTGLDPHRDAIIEVAAVRFSDGDVLGQFSSLVNPERAVPAKIVHLTGIDPHQLVSAPPAHEAVRRLLRFVGSDPVVGHSIGFDLAFLSRYDGLADNRVIDTFELSTILLPHMARHSLQHLAEQLAISSADAHRALGDAEASMRLFLTLREVARALAPQILEQIVALGRRSGWQQAAFFEDMLREHLQRPLGASIGQQIFAKGLLSERPSLLAGTRPEAAPDLEPRDPPTPLNIASIRAALEPGGQLADAIPGYELRPEQMAMLEAVTGAINAGRHLAVEAGTGVGKSLAYLLPAMLYASLNDERFVISTHTINLQEQLFGKDIPQVAAALQLPVRLALLKGRNNYICLSRLNTASNRATITAEQALALAKIISWLPSTATGDRTELFLNTPAERALWSQVCADEAWCQGERCSQKWRGNCFFQRARAAANKAHIIVVNHALLTTDATMESRILPEYNHLVVDEAHQLEQACTRTLRLELTAPGLRETLRDIIYWESGTTGGPLAAIQHLPVLKKNAPAGLDKQIATLTETIVNVQPQIDTAASALESCANSLLPRRTPERSFGEQRRITEKERAQAEWRGLIDAWEPVSRLLRRAVALATEVVRLLPTKGDDDPAVEYSQALAAAARGLEQVATNFDEVIASPDPANVYWLTTQDLTGTPVLNRVPLSVAESLAETIFRQKRSVILTSATLATDSTFDYFAQQVGVEHYESLRVGSPFDYRRNTLVCVAADVPEPRHPGHQRAIEQAIFELARATGGRLMALFTSNSQLRLTSRALVRPLEQEGILVYSQSEGGSRNQLLQGFKSAERAVLLGTRSFWEGVDVPGEALSCLVMVKLPFMVPDDPLVAARGERFRDAFNEYLLPEAILTFRQGFGRLIRSKSDRGVFVLLDSRVRSKAYGQQFIHSLPDCTFVDGPTSALPDRARAWLDGNGPAAPSGASRPARPSSSGGVH